VAGYSDTSFLVSLYTPDLKSAEASSVYAAEGAPRLWLTPFGEAEFLNALELRAFRKELDDQEADAYARAFRHDIRGGSFESRPVPVMTYERAILLSRRHTRQLGTRGMDILHVAIALELKASVFFTFDQTQRKLAHAAGLTVRPPR
jgi:predicted nucleic acid-binding protein